MGILDAHKMQDAHKAYLDDNSWIDLEVFAPARVTCCDHGGEIWHGEDLFLHTIFHTIDAGVGMWDPKKCKFWLFLSVMPLNSNGCKHEITISLFLV